MLSGSKETLTSRAYREIQAMILTGRLVPGQRLPLRPLAESLGMSMAPVGEALHRLQGDGLIETEPRWGARVRRMDADLLRNQHILRTALECEAARECSQRASDRHLAELMKLAQDLDAAIDSHGDPKVIQKLDSKFHLRIAQLSGAKSLVEALERNQLVRLLARGSIIAHDVKRPKRQHIQLVEAIQSRDEEKAAAAMRQHCRRSMQLQLEHMVIEHA